MKRRIQWTYASSVRLLYRRSRNRRRTISSKRSPRVGSGGAARWVSGMSGRAMFPTWIMRGMARHHLVANARKSAPLPARGAESCCPTRRPGPEEVVATHRAKRVEHLAADEEARMASALHGARMHLTEIHPA